MAKRRQAGEGTIFFDDARQLWTARVPSPHGSKPYVRRSKDLKVVKKWFAETKATIERGLPPEPRASETLGAFLRRWIEVARPRLKPRTYASYRQRGARPVTGPRTRGRRPR
jgi:hypothetical protein